ncbi:MAG TPA: hypothetical protein VFO65_02860, partial [Acidimicrobiales bacterium]|nr:hypothetical protein [Acidimicrobiales bacterium]
QPGSVVITGSLQSEVGCAQDWDPTCVATALSFDEDDQVWQGRFAVPAGSYEFRVTIDGSWDESYGANAQPNGANIPLVTAGGLVRFYFDHATHWVATGNDRIAVAAGNHQAALGCPGDWQPDCLRSWLQDPDGNGVLEFATTALPPGSYETKITIDESWSENYGAGGARDGANIAFSVTAGQTVLFSFDSTTHVLTVTAGVPLIAIDSFVDDLDADTPPGPVVMAGSALGWRYVVTNVGDVRLGSIVVRDDQGSVPDCPKSRLEPGESMVCTLAATATAGFHATTATATGRFGDTVTVTAGDPTYYAGAVADLSLVTLVNGLDADVPPGAVVLVGSPVEWGYLVHNVGGTAVSGIAVADKAGRAAACPSTTLRPDEWMACTASEPAQPGQQVSMATATGATAAYPVMSAVEPAYYTGVSPAIDVESLVNGLDADVAPGAEVPVGAALAWWYVVTNTGDVRLDAVTVADSGGLAVTCPKVSLEPGSSMTCTASSTAAAGPQGSTATASASSPGGSVTDTDPAYYSGVTAAVDLEGLVNGVDGDTAPGPEVVIATPLSWSYVVTNTGTARLTSVAVTDDQGLPVTCPRSALAAGESMTCTATSTALVGPHAAVATASAVSAVGAVTDTDATYYTGIAGFEGCAAGFWKKNTVMWPATGYSPGQPVQSVFMAATGYPSLGPATLYQSLSFSGGKGAAGAAGVLLKAGTAALLNAAHPSVSYPRSPAAVVTAVDAALLSGNRATMLELGRRLDADNTAGCPL